MRPLATSVPKSPAAPPPAAAASPWHSPVPYLFGGLAAMLALITLALLILACSYWKLNNYLGTGDDAAAVPSGATDGDGGSKSPAATAAASPAAFADLVAVVMAGEMTPTFLAAPIVRRVRGDNRDEEVAGGEGSPEMEEEMRQGKVGEGESGAVTDAERDRQLDHVLTVM
ncbi:hypothetical protein HU200_061370 [Digitaria exilis]|uniref:Uncharacterized protein n=1 Tax=Digitaria exilis TaxID=1010633 RepID=A0A835DZD8_9POAL|nr:hypothetical protein HU200_061370 [Digitaria exilis]